MSNNDLTKQLRQDATEIRNDVLSRYGSLNGSLNNKYHEDYLLYEISTQIGKLAFGVHEDADPDFLGYFLRLCLDHSIVAKDLAVPYHSNTHFKPFILSILTKNMSMSNPVAGTLEDWGVSGLQASKKEFLQNDELDKKRVKQDFYKRASKLVEIGKFYDKVLDDGFLQNSIGYGRMIVRDFNDLVETMNYDLNNIHCVNKIIQYFIEKYSVVIQNSAGTLYSGERIFEKSVDFYSASTNNLYMLRNKNGETFPLFIPEQVEKSQKLENDLIDLSKEFDKTTKEIKGYLHNKIFSKRKNRKILNWLQNIK